MFHLFYVPVRWSHCVACRIVLHLRPNRLSMQSESFTSVCSSVLHLLIARLSGPCSFTLLSSMRKWAPLPCETPSTGLLSWAFQLATRCSYRRQAAENDISFVATELDEKVGNSTSMDTGVIQCVPLIGALLYGRRPGQPSSTSLARRACVQSPTSSSFLSSSTSSWAPRTT